MRELAILDNAIENFDCTNIDIEDASNELLIIAEELLKNWHKEMGITPRNLYFQGFKLLSLQRQAARNNPSFNACRETCREIAYHYNLIGITKCEKEAKNLVARLRRIVRQLSLFIILECEQNNDSSVFCCNSKTLHTQTN